MSDISVETVVRVWNDNGYGYEIGPDADSGFGVEIRLYEERFNSKSTARLTFTKEEALAISAALLRLAAE